MKIVLIGSDGQDFLESNMKDIFSELGHDVSIVRFIPSLQLAHLGFASRVSKVLLKISFIQNYNEKRIVRSIFKEKAELVVVFTYAANFLTSKSVKEIRGYGTYICSWFVDASVNFLPGRLVVAEYNHNYIADYGLFKSLKDYSWAPMSYLPEGHHPHRHKIPNENHPGSQIAMVGTLYSTRIVQIKKLMKLGYTFNFYGDFSNELIGDELAEITNFYPKVYYEEKSRVFFEALCVLNLPHPSAWNSINCRVFEVLASGGILVTPRNEAILQLLKDRVHAFLYSDFEELLEILGVIHSGKFDRRRMIEEMTTLSMTNSLRERANAILSGVSKTIS